MFAFESKGLVCLLLHKTEHNIFATSFLYVNLSYLELTERN